jgi:hypothetical protein
MVQPSNFREGLRQVKPAKPQAPSVPAEAV